MIPTAREFLESKHIEGSEPRCKAIIEFAKLYCIEQARVISENAITTISRIQYGSILTEFNEPKVDKNSILNAYPLDNIK